MVSKVVGSGMGVASRANDRMLTSWMAASCHWMDTFTEGNSGVNELVGAG